MKNLEIFRTDKGICMSVDQGPIYNIGPSLGFIVTTYPSGIYLKARYGDSEDLDDKVREEVLRFSKDYSLNNAPESLFEDSAWSFQFPNDFKVTISPKH